MKLTKKEKHFLKYILKKMQKMQVKNWKNEEGSNNLPYEMALIETDEAIETLLIELENF